MSKAIVVVVAAAVLVATASANAVPRRSKIAVVHSRPNHDNVDYYDCHGKQDGNYLHPLDCTRFITCSNGRASDMACGDCDKNNVHGCAGLDYLVYDKGADQCEWPVDTQCDTHPPPTTTTAKPPGSHKPCSEIKEGDSCGEDECRHCGFCEEKMSYFLRCERVFPSDPKDPVTGRWVKAACDGNLWWNPDNKPAGESEGGSCDFWDNLSQAVRDAYLNDETCVPDAELCEWGQEDKDKCTGTYWYQPNGNGNRQTLNCSTGLVWDPATETCRGCEHVQGCEGKCGGN
jgi:hypothetical protein